MSKWNNGLKTSTLAQHSGKRVEFSGTEIHFSSDSKKINIRLGSDQADAVRNGTAKSTSSSPHELTPKKGILKNRIATPDKYYLGQLDDVVDGQTSAIAARRKKITHQNHHHHHRHAERDRTPPEAQLKFDTFNGRSASPHSIDSSSSAHRNSQRSPRVNLTSYKLIIDMLSQDDDKSARQLRANDIEIENNDDDDDFLTSHKKSDFAQYNREKIFRPIAKPRKVYSVDAPKMNSLTSSSSHQASAAIKSHELSGDDAMTIKSASTHMSNGYGATTKLSGRRFDLARDEKVLNDLINAADEIINQNM